MPTFSFGRNMTHDYSFNSFLNEQKGKSLDIPYVEVVKETIGHQAVDALRAIFESRKGDGLAVLYDRKAKQTKTRADLRRDTTFGLKVTPVSVMRIDNNYISQRNIPGLHTLAGKNIAIIGCGTIGGYLSEMLVKAGAGVSGGRLTLVDYETLSPQNIGRHRLGFPDLFSNKAVAMAKELTRLHPGFDIRALPNL
jgi:hypothetical protein